MKRVLSLSCSMVVLVAAGWMVTGCSQTPQNTTSLLNEASVPVKSDEGSCGNCAGEQLAADQTEGCCGRCKDETAEASSAGCCGKCSGESVAARQAEKSQGGCQGECNACAEGDSTNCQCDDAPAASSVSISATDEAGQSAARANTIHEDRDIFHFLLANHDKITRTVTELDNGVTTVTESSDPVIAGKIQEHVASMYERVENGRRLRMWDELYREIFKHADKIEMQIKNTENGISVTETSDDEYVVQLIQAHAQVVTGFTERGFEEARENHEPPGQ